MTGKEKVPVGVLGATGMVGEQIVRRLVDHPWFEVVEVTASPENAGRRYGEVLAEAGEVDGEDPPSPLPDHILDLVLEGPTDRLQAPLLLSALPRNVALEWEERLALRGHGVVSNASAFRTDPDVPLVIPEVNPGHLEALARQHRRWPGFIVTNPNCAVAGLATALAPLHRDFGLRNAVVTTFQALSGAGRAGFLDSLPRENVVPLPGEEPKLADEPRKILGRNGPEGFAPADFPVSATATRVPVRHGHLLAVSVGLEKDGIGPDEVALAMREWHHALHDDPLPSSPPAPIEVRDEPDRPQPRLDAEGHRGMSTVVGRIRKCEVLDMKFLVLAHNLERGAAGAAVLNAELCARRGLVPEALSV